VSLPSSYRSRRGHIHLLRVLPLVGCRSKTPTEPSEPTGTGIGPNRYDRSPRYTGRLPTVFKSLISKC
jgi:hypothetical protein